MIPLSMLMLANLILSIVYYLRTIRIILLSKPTWVSKRASEAPKLLLIPMFILAALCILIGVYPGPFIAFASRAAEAALDLQRYIVVTQ